MELVNHTTLKFYQLDCSGTIPLNNSHLGATTNSRQSDLIYQILESPKFGTLTKLSVDPTDNQRMVASSFTQFDVDHQLIQYSCDKLNRNRDDFKFQLYHIHDSTKAIRSVLHLLVLPNVQQRIPAIVPSGAGLTISTDVLDANQLKKSTGKVPVFVIKKPFLFGRLLSVAPDNSQPALPILQFSQDDLERNFIVYANEKRDDTELKTAETMVDTMHYSLTINGMTPPAEGQLNITILREPKVPVPIAEETNTSTIFPTKRPVHIPAMNSDHLIPIIAGIVVCILAGAFIVVCKVKITRKRQQLLRSFNSEPAYSKHGGNGSLTQNDSAESVKNHQLTYVPDAPLKLRSLSKTELL